jgi:hypothetical protein
VTMISRIPPAPGPGMRAVRVRLALALALAVGLGPAACADLETVKPPSIATTGGHAVRLGATLQIVAMTSDGKDTAYRFDSATPATATVDESGLVTGVALGETSIQVTGANTGAVAHHAVVVTSANDRPDSITPAEVPYYDKWRQSAHADVTAEAFTHWNKDGEVPATCAGCHSSSGFSDLIGADGSAPGRVDQAAPVGSTVACGTCHSPQAAALSSVRFPSGVVIDGLGPEARCMTCHQGRASGADVDKAIAASGVKTDDEVSPQLNFLNIHYYPAAATLLAGQVKGGFQYPGQVYDTRFRHVEEFNTCVECHDPHAARPRFDACGSCHSGVTDVTSARKIRMFSSFGRDYDGDGNVTEGVYDELVGLRAKLLQTIQRYGSERLRPLCYDEATYPYWFVDGNNDGACSAEEAVAANAFKGWNARLLRATYNFQMAAKDPGAFAHNAKYIFQLLYDAIADVNSAVIVKIDTTRSVRGDTGHFNGASEAARHWDQDEAVDAGCSRCHGGQSGFRFFVEHGVSIDVPETANGLECGTCHTSFGDSFDVLAVPSVAFPSGVTRADPGHDNLCGTCHSGRASKSTVDATIASGKLRFVNIHYLPAAAVKLGAEAAGGYQYSGKTYAGSLKHTGGVQCNSCHDAKASGHSFRVENAWDARCSTCHADAGGQPERIRLTHTADYDGDGNARETLQAELAGLAAKVLAAMQTAAPTGLCYADLYPYFFKDTDGDRKPDCSTAEAVTANQLTAWTPALVKATYNYQLARKEPGAWAHNFSYVGQLLYDSVEDLGAPVTGLVRP